MFGGDHVPGPGQVHEHRAEVRERRRGAHVQPVGDGRRVAERTDPQAVADGIPDVVRGHGNEEHPWQGAPGVLEAADPHEEAQGEAEDGDEGGAVEGGAVWERDSSLNKQERKGSHQSDSENFEIRMEGFIQLEIIIDFKFMIMIIKNNKL